MNYQNILLLALIYPILIQSVGSPKFGSPKFKVQEIKEQEVFENDERDAALFNSINSVEEFEKPSSPFPPILNLEYSVEEESPSSPIFNLTKTNKDWITDVYIQKDKNLATFLGCCASLCIENNDELSLRIMYKNLKVFFLSLDDNADTYDLFCEYVNVENFINNPVTTIFEFLWQYQFKLNKAYFLYDIKLNRIIFAFAQFINEDEENLFKQGLEFFIKQCEESFDPQYLSKYINKIFVTDICINHKLFKNLDGLTHIYLKLFLGLGVDLNYCGHSDKVSSAITTAVKNNYVLLAHFLFENGVDANFKCMNRSCNIEPLAHNLDSIEMMKLLAQNKVIFDQVDQYGFSALYPLVKKIYQLNMLRAKDATEFRQILSQHQEIVIHLLNEKTEADEFLVKLAEDLLSKLDSSEKISEYKQIIADEFSPEKMQQLISLFKKN